MGPFAVNPFLCFVPPATLTYWEGGSRDDDLITGKGGPGTITYWEGGSRDDDLLGRRVQGR